MTQQFETIVTTPKNLTVRLQKSGKSFKGDRDDDTSNDSLAKTKDRYFKKQKDVMKRSETCNWDKKEEIIFRKP